MADSDAGVGDASTKERIMEATRESIRKHGFSETSISKIGDEFEMSKTTIYHHYDDKEDLFNHFLDYLLEQFEDGFARNTSDDPWARLEAIVEVSLPLDADEEYLALLRAMMELRTQSIYQREYAEKVRKHDLHVEETIGDIIQNGIDAGEFRSVDPDRTARFIHITIYGAHFRALSHQNQEALYDARKDLHYYLEQHVYRS